MTHYQSQNWAEHIHAMVRRSKWEERIEEWEEDEDERCVAYTLFNGDTLVVFEDGRYEHYHDEVVDTGKLRR